MAGALDFALFYTCWKETGRKIRTEAARPYIILEKCVQG